jgi:hypothetical protein
MIFNTFCPSMFVAQFLDRKKKSTFRNLILNVSNLTIFSVFEHKEKLRKQKRSMDPLGLNFLRKWRLFKNIFNTVCIG